MYSHLALLPTSSPGRSNTREMAAEETLKRTSIPDRKFEFATRMEVIIEKAGGRIDSDDHIHWDTSWYAGTPSFQSIDILEQERQKSRILADQGTLISKT
jgi:hypothetical protein